MVFELLFAWYVVRARVLSRARPMTTLVEVLESLAARGFELPASLCGDRVTATRALSCAAFRAQLGIEASNATTTDLHLLALPEADDVVLYGIDNMAGANIMFLATTESGERSAAPVQAKSGVATLQAAVSSASPACLRPSSSGRSGSMDAT